MARGEGTYDVTFSNQIAGNSITACTYSADDAVLAVGSADGNIVLLDTKARFSRLVQPKVRDIPCLCFPTIQLDPVLTRSIVLASTQGHEECITHFSFSTNGRFVLSAAGAQNQAVWCARTGRRQSAAQISEIEWSSSVRESAYNSISDANIIFMFARRRGQRQVRRFVTRYATAVSPGGLVKLLERHDVLQM